jgi:hypothetical protein
MRGHAIAQLVAKDCSLMRVPLLAYSAAAAASLVLAAVGGALRPSGITLALNVMIGASFHILLGPVMGERDRKTLAFVMSLPVTPRQAAFAKLVSAFALFLVPGLIVATTLVFLSPVDVFAAMAASHRSLLSHAADGSATTASSSVRGRSSFRSFSRPRSSASRSDGRSAS